MADLQAPAAPDRLSIKRLKRTVVGLAIAILVIGVAFLEREPLLQHSAAWWAVSDEPTPADAIVVLGGDLDVRPFAAAALYKRGLAGTILLSNVRLGRAERLGFIPTHTELNRDILLRLDVPSTVIVSFGEKLSSTEEEAAAVRQWALQSRAKRVIVPTAMFATRRTRWIFNRELAPIGVQAIVLAFPTGEQYTLTDWWLHRDGVVDFNNEVLKYLYYRIRF